eukprot:NODE_73_length_3485_cov_13.410652_g65_i0.p2 GENE.NODE_73_length_3485_cov_13.410652_g65_i0~~NODE_73_length_3485_cov_13.410652_g65_i0.p2  ORF type:complete len:484 (+),score=120.54 NODE_73_length_3485_cov_13.410652_g65_i0:233-1684(+)
MAQEDVEGAYDRKAFFAEISQMRDAAKTMKREFAEHQRSSQQAIAREVFLREQLGRKLAVSERNLEIATARFEQTAALLSRHPESASHLILKQPVDSARVLDRDLLPLPAPEERVALAVQYIEQNREAEQSQCQRLETRMADLTNQLAETQYLLQERDEELGRLREECRNNADMGHAVDLPLVQQQIEYMHNEIEMQQQTIARLQEQNLQLCAEAKIASEAKSADAPGTAKAVTSASSDRDDVTPQHNQSLYEEQRELLRNKFEAEAQNEEWSRTSDERTDADTEAMASVEFLNKSELAHRTELGERMLADARNKLDLAEARAQDLQQQIERLSAENSSLQARNQSTDELLKTLERTKETERSRMQSAQIEALEAQLTKVSAMYSTAEETKCQMEDFVLNINEQLLAYNRVFEELVVSEKRLKDELLGSQESIEKLTAERNELEANLSQQTRCKPPTTAHPLHPSIPPFLPLFEGAGNRQKDG